jgi:hypothetical protein
VAAGGYTVVKMKRWNVVQVLLAVISDRILNSEEFRFEFRNFEFKWFFIEEFCG